MCLAVLFEESTPTEVEAEFRSEKLLEERCLVNAKIRLDWMTNQWYWTTEEEEEEEEEEEKTLRGAF